MGALGVIRSVCVIDVATFLSSQYLFLVVLVSGGEFPILLVAGDRETAIPQDNTRATKVLFRGSKCHAQTCASLITTEEGVFRYR